MNTRHSEQEGAIAHISLLAHEGELKQKGPVKRRWEKQPRVAEAPESTGWDEGVFGCRSAIESKYYR